MKNAWVFRPRLPKDVADSIQEWANAAPIASCAICQSPVLVPVARAAIERGAIVQYAVQPDGVHVCDTAGALRYAPRVFDDYVRTADDALHLPAALHEGQLLAPEHLARRLVWRGCVFDNVPDVVSECRPFTRMGSKAFCLACVHRPREALRRWGQHAS